jgi:hypothetical protein
VPRRTPVRRAGAGLSARRGQGAGWRRSTVIPWSDSNCDAPRTHRDADRRIFAAVEAYRDGFNVAPEPPDLCSNLRRDVPQKGTRFGS